MSPAVARDGAVWAQRGGGATPGQPGACGLPGASEQDKRRAEWAARDRRALRALERAYPVGAAVRFGAHLPVLTPRWWRQRAAAAPWGLRAGDPLAVVGHGAALGFPEALLVRRVADGQDALVFPAELAPPPAGRRVEEEARGEPVLEAV
jgi:hypothetical protein